MGTRNQQTGKIRTPVTSNGWHSSAATFTVVADGLKPLIYRDCFDQLGLAVTKSAYQQSKQVNNIPPHSAFKKIALQFPGLISRIGGLKKCSKIKISQTLPTITPKRRI